MKDFKNLPIWAKAYMTITITLLVACYSSRTIDLFIGSLFDTLFKAAGFILMLVTVICLIAMAIEAVKYFIKKPE